MAGRHPILAHGLDGGRDVRVRLAQECLALWSFPGRSEQGMSLIVDAMREDGQEQAVVDVVGVEKGRPSWHLQLHGRIEAPAPGPWVDVAVRLTPVDGFEPVGRCREDVADIVVAHRNRRDRGELRGAAWLN